MDSRVRKSYCDRLKILYLVPLSLYVEKHDIMMPLVILKDNEDVPLETNTRKAYDVTRQFQRSELPIAHTRLLKTNENYFICTQNLYNCLIRACPAFHQRSDKTTLIDIYRDYFKRMFNEINKCTWRLICKCGNCNVYVKLRQNLTRTVKGGNHFEHCSQAYSTTTNTTLKLIK